MYDQNLSGEELQEKISTIGDWINYVYLCKWPHKTADTVKYPYRYGPYKSLEWQFCISGKQLVEQRGGTCGGSASAFAYILKDDYQEIGYMYKTGHFFNYVKNGDKYYIINPADWDDHVFARGTNWSTGYYSGVNSGRTKVDLPIVCSNLQELADDLYNKGISSQTYSCVAVGSLIPADRNMGIFPEGATAVCYYGEPVCYEPYNLFKFGDFTDWNYMVDPGDVCLSFNSITREINAESPNMFISRKEYHDSFGGYLDKIRW